MVVEELIRQDSGYILILELIKSAHRSMCFVKKRERQSMCRGFRPNRIMEYPLIRWENSWKGRLERKIRDLV